MSKEVWYLWLMDGPSPNIEFENYGALCIWLNKELEVEMRPDLRSYGEDIDIIPFVCTEEKMLQMQKDLAGKIKKVMLQSEYKTEHKEDYLDVPLEIHFE